MRACGNCGCDIGHKRRDAIYCTRKCKAAAAERRRPARDDRERYRRERERRLSYARVHYRETAEQQRARAKAWRRANPHRKRRQGERRIEMIEAHPGFRPFTGREWERIKAHYRHSCAYCGAAGVPLEIDHVVPISRGGRHAIGNVVPACVPCNRSKFNHFLSEWKAIRGGR